MNSEKFVQLANGKWISKAECEALKKEFVADVLDNWDEFVTMCNEDKTEEER